MYYSLLTVPIPCSCDVLVLSPVDVSVEGAVREMEAIRLHTTRRVRRFDSSLGLS